MTNLLKNYESVSGGEDIDTLWQLDGALERAPQWHAVYVPSLAEDSDEDLDLVPVRAKGGLKASKKKRLAITSGAADDSNNSMPDLQSVSESSDSDENSDSDDDDGESDDGYEDSDDGYDTDEEDELREMMKEAMNAAMDNPDFFDPKADPKDFDSFNKVADDRKGNPFLKLLGSLRGVYTSFTHGSC
jgi:hypothetical protein